MSRKPHPQDRSRASGLYDQVPAPPQIIDVVVESGAMRSQSQGYVPAIVLHITTDDGKTFQGMMRCDGPEVPQISTDMMEATMHARRDVRAAEASHQPGQGKSHG